jgi:hypothetical protein
MVPGHAGCAQQNRLDGGWPARQQGRDREGIVMTTNIAVQPLEVGARTWATIRLNSVRLALIAFAVAALIVGAFAVGRVTSTSHSGTASTVRNSVPAAVAPAGNVPQQPALACHLHGPC